MTDDLVARAQAGDQTAFRDLYRQHAGRVYALCLRLTGDARDAEERTQDVFVRLWDKLRSFRGESAFSSWLHRLTVTAFGRVFKAEEIFGFSITLNTLLIVLCEVELNFATHHWPQRRNMVIGALLAALGFGGMAFARSVGVIAFNVALYTVGVLTLSFGAGFSIGPWIGTRLLHHYGPTTLWPVMFGVGLLSALCYARLPEPGTRSAVVPPSQG